MDNLREQGRSYNYACVNANPPELERRRLSRNRDYAVGVGLILIVVLLWTTSSFVTQILYRDGYDKPFLVTYASTGPFALYLVPRLIRWLRTRTKGSANMMRSMEGYNPLTTSEFPERLNEGGRDLRTEGHYTSSSQEHDGVPEEKTVDLPPLSLRETAEIGFTFCWLWFIANWAINAALNYTTVTSSAIIASTSGFFTLGLGKIFGVERFTMMKMAAVITCFSGVILVSFSDLQPDSQFSTTTTGPSFSSYLRLHSYSPDISVKQARPLFGDALALLSALFYAFYVIFLKVKVQDESRIDMRLFLGFVGLFDLITCWPVGVVLHKIGVEKFELPATTTQWYALLTNMVILVLSDYLYVLAMLKTTPLLVTVGISLTIPVAVLGDFILNSPTRGQVLAGASLVLLSFIAVGMDKSNMEVGNGAGE